MAGRSHCDHGVTLLVSAPVGAHTDAVANAHDGTIDAIRLSAQGQTGATFYAYDR